MVMLDLWDFDLLCMDVPVAVVSDDTCGMTSYSWAKRRLWYALDRQGFHFCF